MFGSLEQALPLTGEAASTSGLVAAGAIVQDFAAARVTSLPESPAISRPTPEGETLRFRRYSIAPGSRVLLRDEQPLAIGDRAFDLIYVLASARGQVIERRELLRRVWPTTIVDECNLRFQVKCARRVLGEDRDLIKSVAGRGYFFLAEPDVRSDALDWLRIDGPALDARGARSQATPSNLPPDPAGVQSPEDYRASCELLRELLTSVLHDLWALRGVRSLGAGQPGAT